MRRSAFLYRTDIGARIVLSIRRRNGDPYDTLNTASVKQIKVTYPSGAEKVFTAAFATSPFGNGTGTDGMIEYVTTNEADLAESGPHKVQGYFEFSATDKRHSQPVTMYVGAIPGTPS